MKKLIIITTLLLNLSQCSLVGTAIGSFQDEEKVIVVKPYTDINEYDEVFILTRDDHEFWGNVLLHDTKERFIKIMNHKTMKKQIIPYENIAILRNLGEERAAKSLYMKIGLGIDISMLILFVALFSGAH